MNKEQIKKMITDHEAELKLFGVKQLLLFGSFVNENTRNDSDVDILVTMDEVNYKKLAGLHVYLENLLHRKVDLIRKGPHLSSSFLNSTQTELVYG
jgi:uncharacterized protein